MFWSDSDLGFLVKFGSVRFGRIRMFWSDPDVLVGSGCFGRIRMFWSNPGVLAGSGCFGRIRMFWSSPGVLGSGFLVGSEYVFRRRWIPDPYLNMKIILPFLLRFCFNKKEKFNDIRSNPYPGQLNIFFYIWILISSDLG